MSNLLTTPETRLLKYDITKPEAPRYAREYVVPLPFYNDPTAKASKNPKSAAQSEVFHIQNDQFMILSRDSNAGHGAEVTTSQYRHIDLFDISAATDVKGKTYDCATCGMLSPTVTWMRSPVFFLQWTEKLIPIPGIASLTGVLNATITTAQYCSFIDFNINAQLSRFGLHNGGDQDASLLNEKWESIGIVPVDGLNGDDDQWFVFTFRYLIPS